jgi:hypothetical protein
VHVGAEAGQVLRVADLAGEYEFRTPTGDGPDVRDLSERRVEASLASSGADERLR